MWLCEDLLVVEDHLCLLIRECVGAEDVVVALNSLFVEMTMGRQVTVENTHWHSIDLPPDADHTLVTLQDKYQVRPLITSDCPYSPSNLQIPGESTGSPALWCDQLRGTERTDSELSQPAGWTSPWHSPGESSHSAVGLSMDPPPASCPPKHSEVETSPPATQTGQSQDWHRPAARRDWESQGTVRPHSRWSAGGWIRIINLHQTIFIFLHLYY